MSILFFFHEGSGFASKDSYLFGAIHMQIKLIPGDSAGTVTAYYVSKSLTIESFWLKSVSDMFQMTYTYIYVCWNVGGDFMRIIVV